MTERVFNIKYFHPYRGLIIPLAFMGLLFSSIEINKKVSNSFLSIFLIMGLVVIVIGICYYFIYARLLIHIDSEKLRIEWIKRLPFDFNKTQIIKVNEIAKLLINKSPQGNQREIKIYYGTDNFYINSYDNKYFRANIVDFMDYLNNLSKLKSIPIVDSWDEWNDKGFLKIGYIINNIVLVISVLCGVIGIFLFFLKGFHSYYLTLFILPAIPQLISTNKKMKEKLNKNKDKNDFK